MVSACEKVIGRINGDIRLSIGLVVVKWCGITRYKYYQD